MITDIHVAFVILTLLAVAYSDFQAFLWLIGRKETLSGKSIFRLHTAVSVGLALLIITGGMLYARAPVAYLSDTTFIVKMIAVAALIINTYVIGLLAPIATSRKYVQTTQSERTKLFISGGVSIAGWATALICGLLLG